MRNLILRDKLLSALREEMPEFSVKFKKDSILHRLIGVLVYPFNRQYMKSYVTTIGTTVWFPGQSSWDRSTAWVTLAHEYVHAWDYKNESHFKLKYLMPQILALPSLLAFLAFFNLWFLLFLGFLVFAAPWRAKRRSEYEIRGYSMSLACYKWYYGDVYPSYFLNAAKQFTSPNYYWMWRDEQNVLRRLNETLAKVTGEEEPEGEEWSPFLTVGRFLESQGEKAA